MKTLVIAEKPSVAQDIVRALTPVAGKFEKHDEHFENESYVVNLPGITDLKLTIVPDISGGPACASLRRLRVR